MNLNDKWAPKLDDLRPEMQDITHHPNDPRRREKIPFIKQQLFRFLKELRFDHDKEHNLVRRCIDIVGNAHIRILDDAVELFASVQYTWEKAKEKYENYEEASSKYLHDSSNNDKRTDARDKRKEWITSEKGDLRQAVKAVEEFVEDNKTFIKNFEKISFALPPPSGQNGVFSEEEEESSSSSSGSPAIVVKSTSSADKRKSLLLKSPNQVSASDREKILNDSLRCAQRRKAADRGKKSPPRQATSSSSSAIPNLHFDIRISGDENQQDPNTINSIDSERSVQVPIRSTPVTPVCPISLPSVIPGSSPLSEAARNKLKYGTENPTPGQKRALQQRRFKEYEQEKFENNKGVGFLSPKDLREAFLQEPPPKTSSSSSISTTSSKAIPATSSTTLTKAKAKAVPPTLGSYEYHQDLYFAQRAETQRNFLELRNHLTRQQAERSEAKAINQAHRAQRERQERERRERNRTEPDGEPEAEEEDEGEEERAAKRSRGI
jgi:hypothetical protein